MNENRRNPEGYLDLTAHAVISKMTREEERFHKLLYAIFDICELSGFEIEGRITLVDKKTGRVWK